MVEIIPGAFHASFPILTPGQSDYYYIEIKIKMMKELVLCLLITSFSEDSEVQCSRAVILTDLGASSWMLREMPICTVEETSKYLPHFQLPCLP